MGLWMRKPQVYQIIIIFIILWDGRITPTHASCGVFPEKPVHERRPKIYLFGDSNTEFSFKNDGWGSSLAALLARRVDIVLRGYAGFNSRWALEATKKVFPKPGCAAGNATAVTVSFGANDACLPYRSCADHSVPIEEYKNNLHAIVAFVRKLWPSTKILLITPPPIDEASRLLHPFSNDTSGLLERTNEAAGKYAEACVEVAAECGAGVVDLWTKMQQCPDWKDHLSDGVHLNNKGNKVLFEEVVARFKEVGVSPEDLWPDNPLSN